MKLARLLAILSLSIGNFGNAYSNVETNKYEACFDTAEQYYQVPKEILKAIAFVESHYNSNAYNENSNGTYDIGLMQINSTWLPKLASLGITEQMLYEPCQSIYMGAWVLANNIKTYGLNWTAVQRYNGNDVDLKYATKVYNRIQETYPSFLSPSQAKLIPINLKSVSNLPKKSNKNITVNSKENTDKNLIVNYSESKIHKVETAQEYSNEVDIILRKSGVKSIPTITQNNVVTSSEIDKKITQKRSSNFVKIEAESNINFESNLSKILVNSQPKIKHPIADICNINGYWVCYLSAINFMSISSNLVKQNFNFYVDSKVRLSKKFNKINHKNPKNKTSTMLVI